VNSHLPGGVVPGRDENMNADIPMGSIT
jgi:hypothetical protein